METKGRQKQSVIRIKMNLTVEENWEKQKHRLQKKNFNAIKISDSFTQR